MNKNVENNRVLLTTIEIQPLLKLLISTVIGIYFFNSDWGCFYFFISIKNKDIFIKSQYFYFPDHFPNNPYYQRKNLR